VAKISRNKKAGSPGLRSPTGAAQPIEGQLHPTIVCSFDSCLLCCAASGLKDRILINDPNYITAEARQTSIAGNGQIQPEDFT
jgi:hypothetical protein